MNSIFNQFSSEATVDDILGKVSGIKVPNRFPTLSNFPYRIAVIGEAPGVDEELQGQPFVGHAGKLLNGLLSKAGIVREAIFIGNVCQYRPPGNKIENFDRDGKEFTEGLAQLNADLTEFYPHVCLLLGKTALWAFKGVDQISNYRGSLFLGDLFDKNYKCIAACLRQFDWTVYLWFDIIKCLSEATSPDLVLPQRNLEINLPYEELLRRLNDVNNNPRLISVDIEGGVGSLSCCSVADSATNSFIVPFAKLDASNYWNEEQEIEVWRAFAKVLTNPNVPKVFQNGLYDRFVLQYSYNITVRGCVDDTMLKWAEKYCELEKALAVQSSILTKEPYYKFERKADTKEAFYTYCCKDSSVTYEINDKLENKLDDEQKSHYHFNNAMLNPILYMELRGIRYDQKQAKERLEEINRHIYVLQAKLDALAGVGVDRAISKSDLATKIKQTCCYKKDASTPKKEFEDDFPRLIKIVQQTSPLTEEEIGFINTTCKWLMNTKSDKFKTFLYTTLQLPKQYDPKTKALTTDYEALLKLSKKTPHDAVKLSIELGKLRTRSQMLGIHADADGRIRCGYNIVGTETGRITCYTSPTGSGYNLQTIPDENHLKPQDHPLRRGLRSLFVADEGCYMFQCDLSGADGWTVGAHLTSLGDPTMLDDLRFGLKPAAIVCYMLRHGNGSLIGKSRPKIKELLKEVKKEDWDYFACKQGIWMTCYTGGPRKLSEVILIQSEGKVVMSEAEVRTFQQAVFQRYNVHLWHRWMERKLKQKPELVSPNGHRRRFYGRSTEILGQALAHEPQMNTTYATNLAAWRLWTDKENRIVNDNISISARNDVWIGDKSVSLRIEPLHTVHDALIGQFKIGDTAWASNKIRTWFANEITIAGIPITIPFEGHYGESWGNLTKGII